MNIKYLHVDYLQVLLIFLVKEHLKTLIEHPTFDSLQYNLSHNKYTKFLKLE